MAINPTRLSLLVAALVLHLPAGLPAQETRDDRAAAFVRGLASGKLSCALDPLVDIPAVWSLTPDKLDQLFAVPDGIEIKKNPYFEWLTTSRDRAHFISQPYSNLAIDLSFFGNEVPVEEVTVDFTEEGRLNGVTVSVYNRGDAGSIDASEFERRKKICGQQLGKRLGVRPVARKANLTQGLLTEGWTWFSKHGMAVLEHNPEAASGQPEFLRLRFAPRNASGAFAAAMSSRSAAVKLSDLPRNVVRDSTSGDTYIKNIPMVDQGPKGYCVVAACQRLFEYYGIPCDQHQIAQIAGSDASRGTSSLAMAQSLDKIDYRFKTRFKPLFMLMTTGRLHEMRNRKPADFRDFQKQVVSYVDDGVPLLWALELGRFPEDPPIAPQTAGGHMRLVIGYNSKTDHLLFSDTWGAGHEKKRMTFDDAFRATHGLFVMTPTTR